MRRGCRNGPRVHLDLDGEDRLRPYRIVSRSRRAFPCVRGPRLPGPRPGPSLPREQATGFTREPASPLSDRVAHPCVTRRQEFDPGSEVPGRCSTSRVYLFIAAACCFATATAISSGFGNLIVGWTSNMIHGEYPASTSAIFSAG